MSKPHEHKWQLADNQEGVGRVGVRVVCFQTVFPHYQTMHRDLVKRYL